MAVALSINPCWLLEVKTLLLIYNSQWTQRPLKRCKFGLFVEREVHEPGDGPPTLSASNNTLHGRGSQIRRGGAFNWGKVTDLFITSLRHPLEPSLMLRNWILHIPKVPVYWTAVCVAWKHWEAAFVKWTFGVLSSNSVRLPLYDQSNFRQQPNDRNTCRQCTFLKTKDNVASLCFFRLNFQFCVVTVWLGLGTRTIWWGFGMIVFWLAWFCYQEESVKKVVLQPHKQLEWHLAKNI